MNKLIYLVPDNIDSSFVGRIQMYDESFIVLVVFALKRVDKIDDGCGLTRSGRSVQEKVWEVIRSKY